MSRTTQLEHLDLNLLVLFRHLLVERSVSKVAEVLGLSQPAVSNALSRLRKALGDELFIRTPAGMVPTPFADQLAGSVTEALGMIHAALNQRSAFDPRASDRSFVLSMTDIGEIYFLPGLMEALREQAPGVTLSTFRQNTADLRATMEAGQVDLAIGLLPDLKAGFFQRRLFKQRYVCMVRKGHRLDRRRISLADFSAAEHLMVISSGTGHGQVDEILRRRGIERRVALTVPHFVAVGHILQATDLVATVPERLADRMKQPFGLVAVPHPADLPEVGINMFWHAKYHRDPANQWLRGLVFERFGG
ncbi:LysR family transcriptional regulator [Ramlibacter sp. AW1]|uniref:LysR family transcriptional regulator n=1 Tax=Ramlibacter aurantiacus TaxID=2801330 RepID=A0A937D4M1_9BURK|nr:LysR family transcriptional regulator [Ramlibacter aurantiacus]MBL0419033.1 LysR family transcriptional regulator [Ramlibacter aurantiacus]